MKKIDEFDDYYVTNDGKVFSTKRGKIKELKPDIAKEYKQVSLSKNGKAYRFKVHVLVLEAFNCRRPLGMVACHNNGIKQDNRIENLRWGTISDNCNDCIKHGNWPSMQAENKHKHSNKGEKNGRCKLTELDVLEIRKLISEGKKQIFIAQLYGVSQVRISMIKLKKTWWWL